MNYSGIIIEESLKNLEVLAEVAVLKTEIETVTPEHHTPWLSQWTLHTVEISEEKVDLATKILSQTLISQPSAWYADFKNENTHFIIFPGKIFKINKNSQQEYDAAKRYGISLGIPEHQVDFHPEEKKWER
ncbi:MAG: hypothetical protein V4467_00780 [Patescibacteria group bacterium]